MVFGGFSQRKAALSSEYELRHFSPDQLSHETKKELNEGKGSFAGLKLVLLCYLFCIRACFLSGS